jgi:arylsulfatase
VPLRIPRIINIRADPFEEGEHGWTNWQYTLDHAFLLVPAQQYVGDFLATFKEFPPSQKVGSFSIDNVLKNLSEASTSGR